MFEKNMPDLVIGRLPLEIRMALGVNNPVDTTLVGRTVIVEFRYKTPELVLLTEGAVGLAKPEETAVPVG